jgi:hypothetical protein
MKVHALSYYKINGPPWVLCALLWHADPLLGHNREINK